MAVEGVDVFDGQGAVDWPALARSGVAFAFVKSTQGTYDVQRTFAANWSGARDAGLPRGAYHFFDPTEDGASQAERFLAAVGPYEPGDLPPMLDLECPDGDDDCLGTGASGQADPGVIAERMWAWLRTVEQATGTRPIIYTFADYFQGSGVDPRGLDAYPLFLAYPTAAACVPVPAPWSTATLWQYSWSGTAAGVRGPVDRDRFLGTAAELVELGARGAARLADGLDAWVPDAPRAMPSDAALGDEALGDEALGGERDAEVPDGAPPAAPAASAAGASGCL